MPYKPVVLLILDGWGISHSTDKNAVINSETAPNYFSWRKKYAHAELLASGKAVGLLPGQEGNSEAGHLNLGAGRVVKQEAVYISESIHDGTFFKNSAFFQAVEHSKKYTSVVHLVGLLSGCNSAHSLPDHLYALVQFLHDHKQEEVYIHLFTDGRDSGQHDALHFLEELKKHFRGSEKIASIMGRLYGMDRGKNWDRTKIAYGALVEGVAKYHAPTPEEALRQAYNRSEHDEFIMPTIIEGSYRAIQNNDSVIFFNLRSDRARELTKAIVQPQFEEENPHSFQRNKILKNICFVAMTDFGPDLPGILTAYPSRNIQQGLVETLCPRPQLYIAESEKFAHITYFFNGGYAGKLCREEQIKIPSDTIKHYETKPAMKTREIAATIIKNIETEKYSFIAANFAASDMVGHTGNIEAAKTAIKIIDEELQKIIDSALKKNGVVIITADHGNVEEMIDAKTGEIDTEHSVNPVPFFLIATQETYKALGIKKRELAKGKLANVAPTILKVMGIEKPKEMTGKSLF